MAMPKTRSEARAKSLPRYLGKCKKHGECEVYTVTNVCVECTRQYNKRSRAKKSVRDPNITYAAILHGDGHITRVFKTKSQAQKAARASWKKKYGVYPDQSDPSLGRTDDGQ